VKILKNALLLMLALLWVSSAHASVNYVLNGDFEQTANIAAFENTGGSTQPLDKLPSGYWAIYGSLPSWQSNSGYGIEVHHGVVDEQMNPANAKDNLYVELDTTNNSNMYQEINGLTAGQYLLSFSYFSRTQDSSSDIKVSFGGVDLLTTNYYIREWTEISKIFTYAGGNSILSFVALGGSEGLGGYIDNVSITSVVPLPGAAILFGSGLLGLVGLRRRQIV